MSDRLQLSKVRRQIAASCTSTGAMLGVHCFPLPPLKAYLAVIDLRNTARQIRHSFQHRGLQTRVQHQAAMALRITRSPCWGDSGLGEGFNHRSARVHTVKHKTYALQALSGGTPLSVTFQAASEPSLGPFLHKYSPSSHLQAFTDAKQGRMTLYEWPHLMIVTIACVCMPAPCIALAHGSDAQHVLARQRAQVGRQGPHPASCDHSATSSSSTPF